MKTTTSGLLVSAVATGLAIPSFAQTTDLDIRTVTGLLVPPPPAIEHPSDNRSEMSSIRLAAVAPEKISQTDRAENGRRAADRRQRAGSLEEVVVTAQKREERLIEVPMSITAVSGEQLADEGIKNVRDLSYAVPSLSVLESGAGRQIITIRGMAGQRGTSSLTGLYLDEAPLSGMQDGVSGVYADIRTIDLERVEVLKGPQGTLFGEGAAGGVIRFITNDPDLSRLGGDISTEFYNTDDGGWSEEVGGVLNLPIVDEVLGIRVAAKYDNTDGWIDQPSIDRKNINDSEVKHVRMKALYVPSAEFRVKALAEIHRNDGGASNIVNQKPLRESNFIQSVLPDARTDYTDNYEVFNLTAAYQLGFGELLSSTSYMQIDSVQSFTQRTGEQPVPYFQSVGTGSSRDGENRSQELRLTSSSLTPFKWTIGALYKESELAAWSGREGSHLGLFGGATTLTGRNLGPRSILTSKSWAEFADASYMFAARLEVGGGVRHFTDERESFGINPSTVRLSGDFKKTTFRAYLRYMFSENANVYLTVGNGFRSGGLNTAVAVARGAPPNILPETSLFYELGTKISVLDGRLSFDGAIFYGEYQDMQADSSRPSTIDQIPVQFTSNGQDAELKGAELSVTWVATDRLTLAVAGDVIDTEITRVDATSLAPVYFLGDPISLSPEYTVAVSVDYEFDWMDSVPGNFRIGFNQKGKSYNTERTNVFVLDHQIVSPEVRFLDASIGAEWNSWTLSVFGRNLLDEDEWLYPTVSGWSAQARPRTVGVGVNRSF